MRTLALVVAATALTTIVVACGAGPDEDATVATPTVSEAAPEPSEPGREPAPAIEGVSLDGDSVSLADLRGRPVLINVWSSW